MALPRRMQTRTSFGLDADEAISNASFTGVSASARRHLLNAQNGVTSLLGAERLWEQGFKGARVKMGVFDTGIRADHPHVKNIRCAHPYWPAKLRCTGQDAARPCSLPPAA